jgi:UDP-4-amino-4,6-dideoxy-N-acetyl-beta-L-altrosamine transaminase
MTYIPYGRQVLSQEDLDAVADVLNSDFLTQGPAVPRFEKDLSEFTGAKYVKVTSSATGALHLACLALEVGVGDVVWTTAVTFVASANCALYCGATIDLVDIDSESRNISLDALERKLELASTGYKPLPKVVIVVHLAGLPVDMHRVRALSKVYGFKVIEDASHAIGALTPDGRVGAGKYSDLTVFSFHPVKIITTGEGGAVMTNDSELARKVELLRSHGITRDPSEMKHGIDGPWYYEQQALGFNYRMTDIQAALGSSQLRKIEDFIASRKEIVELYNALFLEVSGVITPLASESSSWHLYVIQIPEGLAIGTRNQVFERLRLNGIGANLHYIPIYRHPFFASMGFTASDFPEAEKYYREAISIPIYPGLSEAQQREIVSHIAAPFGHQTIF